MKILTILLPILILAPYTIAQKKINKDQFNAIYQKSLEALKGKSYRKTGTIETKTTSFFSVENENQSIHDRPQYAHSPTDGALSAEDIYIQKVKIEISSNGDSHSLWEGKFLSSNTKTEYYKIGKNEYKRTGTGQWQLGTSQFASAPDLLVPPIETDYEFIGSAKLNGSDAEVFQVTEKSRTDAPGSSVIKSKYWFGKDGNLLKTVVVSDFYVVDSLRRTNLPHERKNPKTRIRKQEILFYTIDPNIKIESPVL